MGDVKIEREMLSGTDGFPVYLVIDNVDGMALGIRPVVLPQMKSMFVGWRLRLCNNENTDSPVNIEEVLKKSLLNAFEWSKIDAVRASAVFGAQLPMPIGVGIDTVMSDIEKAKLVKGLVAELNKNFTINHPVEDVIDFTSAVFKVEIAKLITMLVEATGKMAVAVSDGNDTVH